MNKFKSIVFVAVASVSFFSTPFVSYGQNPPAGSYSKSCRECTVNNNNVLTCQCQASNGMTYFFTSINVTKCSGPGSNIANCNGALVCGNCK